MHGKRLIVLSSRDARVACEKYYPVDTARVRVVRFAVQRPEARGQRSESCRYGAR